jgi:hypothetical protein
MNGLRKIESSHLDNLVNQDRGNVMSKTMKKVIIFVFLVLTIIGTYWFLIHPNTYKYKTAARNNNVVNSLSGNVNVNKLYNFIRNVENKKQDKIRIVSYTIEGDAIITDLKYDGNIIKCRTDSTRDRFGSRTINHGEYTKIIMDENDRYLNYRLVDENGKYPDEGIFHERKKFNPPSS